MNTRQLTILLGLAGIVISTAAEPAQGFKTFHLIQTRNVFDPNRRPSRVEIPTQRTSTTKTRSRSNSLSLTGTMVTTGKSLAFFNGSRSEYSKVIGVGDSVADFKVAAINAMQVELEKDGKRTSIAVGSQLTLEGSTVETVSTEPGAPSDDAPETPTDATTTGAPNPPSAPAPAGSDDKNDVVRRMMERREKEMKK